MSEQEEHWCKSMNQIRRVYRDLPSMFLLLDLSMLSIKFSSPAYESRHVGSKAYTWRTDARVLTVFHLFATTAFVAINVR